MFSHKGKTRTAKHDLEIATILSFVAGLVNVVGFFSVHKLTTNITGHFAYFVDAAFKMQFLEAFHLALYVFFFFLGAFFSNLLIEIFSRIRENLVYVMPVVIEAIILSLIAFTGRDLILKNPDVIAFSLLFAMGLQNSMVTSISHAVVRTTHLTGLFTDMGIDFSQLFFKKSEKHKKKLIKSIKLRLTIIWSFFFGGVFGGFLYNNYGIKALFFGSFILISALLYDFIKLQIHLSKRRVQ